jgi:ParB family chromosome partitioning protein
MAKTGLGRGLGELLGDVDDMYSKDIKEYKKDIISISKIDANPNQPRKTFDDDKLEELSVSIKEHGVLQPIIVQQNNDRFIIVAGERRLRACKKINIKDIPCVIIETKKDNIRTLAIIENIQREELPIMELAFAYSLVMKEHDITHEELADTLGKSRTHITNTLRLLKLNENIQNEIQNNNLSSGHGKIIAGLSTNQQNDITKKIIKDKISVRDTESLVKSIKTNITINQDKILKIKNILDRLNIKSVINKDKLSINFKENKHIDDFYNLINR